MHKPNDIDNENVISVIKKNEMLICDVLMRNHKESCNLVKVKITSPIFLKLLMNQRYVMQLASTPQTPAIAEFHIYNFDIKYFISY
jgi:hypothetical protein